MRRFFCPPGNISKDKIIINDLKELRHILKVMRAEKGDKIIVFDGQGREYLAKISDINKDMMIADNLKEEKSAAEAVHITLACALPKKQKFEFIIEKATELGVDRIIPLMTQRTEVKIGGSRLQDKLKRWQTVAVNAAKQCHRSVLPEITEVRQMREIFSVGKFNLIVIPVLFGGRNKLRDVLTPRFKGSVLVIIGPEGDFTPDEAHFAIANGAKPVTLGETVLKVDTAAIVSLAMVRCLTL
ncbi:MAG: RsmE family RNA methyltransferase [Candidatus Omnitrophica bacterium]|nr:RsmE family RNA methyltransferase [Candidatus Omnitrophota bacterium]